MGKTETTTRVSWRLGGSRGAARQSVTFHGSPRGRAKLAQSAKELVEARSHNITRDECRKIILGVDDEPTVPLLKDWIHEWLDGRAERREIQPDVIRSYRTVLTSRAAPYLGHLRLTDIDHEVLKNWIGWMASSRITIGSKNRRAGNRLLSATTVHRTHAILHACLNGAVPKWLTHNPAALPPGSGRHGLPKKEHFEGMFLTTEEVHLILDHCDPHIRGLVLVAVHSGLRLGELIALEAQHVVFTQKGEATIVVRQARKNDGTVGEPKSRASRRDVPVDGEASAVLAERIERVGGRRRPRALVFPSPEGGMWDEHNLRDRYWYAAVAAARRCPVHPPAVPLKPERGPARRLRHDEVSTCGCAGRLRRRPRFHDLRHSHASFLIQDGMHLVKIQKRLGHASYQTTASVYSHLVDHGNSAELAGLAARLADPRAIAGRRAAAGETRRRRGGVLRRRVRRAGPGWLC